MRNAHRLIAAVVAVIVVIAAEPTAAQGMGSNLIPNFVGIGVGSTPQYAGAKKNVVLAAPGMRYQFEGSERFFEWYGTLADMNLIDSKAWQFGPALNLRLGRSDVDDEVVAKLPDVDTTVEGGVLASYTYVNTDGVPYGLRVGVVGQTP